jgi:LuxR family maltose regulon positive regulatory protein
MARATPRIHGTSLLQPGQQTDLIEVGTPTWFAWLEAATTFAFADAAGSFTARKERSGRSGAYWKAYRMRGRMLRRVYLGKSSDLTLVRLQAAAQELAERAPGIGTSRVDQDLPQHDHTAGSQSPMLGALLLAAKLSIPQAPAELIARAQLVDRLNLGLRGRLTLLSAPAGFGKTTLLSAWLHGIADCRLQIADLPHSTPQPPTPNPQPPALAWVSLDAEDNDPVRFWSYIIGALAGVCPGVGAVAMNARSADQGSISAMLTGLLNTLSLLTYETLLVLDDYHLIDATPVHQALAFFIERLPRQLHLVIATRADPPLPLTRLRARGELTELRGPDLRFTLDETSAFLIERRGLAFTIDDVAKLHMRTEGWAAGLQLAAAAARGCGDLAAFVATFNGGTRFVMDYLVDEVLNRLPAHMQDVVLRTSILDRMCDAVCEAVMDEGQMTNDESTTPLVVRPSSSVFGELERANLLISLPEDQRTWYRYPQLLVEAAHERLRTTTSAEDVATLHSAASAWYAQHAQEGQLYRCEAIRHALLARDWERSAQLIEQHGLLLTTGGLPQTVCGWLEALPAGLIRTRPILCVYYAIALMFLGRLDAVEARLHDA